MKKEIHPDYHPVVFVDSATGDEILTKSTITSDEKRDIDGISYYCLLYTSPSPRDRTRSRMPSSA